MSTNFSPASIALIQDLATGPLPAATLTEQQAYAIPDLLQTHVAQITYVKGVLHFTLTGGAAMAFMAGFGAGCHASAKAA